MLFDALNLLIQGGSVQYLGLLGHTGTEYALLRDVLDRFILQPPSRLGLFRARPNPAAAASLRRNTDDP